MKTVCKIKPTIAYALFIVFLSLSVVTEGKVKKVYSDSFYKAELTQIFNHLIKNEFDSKSLKSITINKSVKLYNLNRGLTDSTNINLSDLKLDDTRVIFADTIPSSSFSIDITRINYFITTNKYEIRIKKRAGNMGGHGSSYVYKRRKGLFKRWVYKRYTSSIWCGYW